MISLVRASDDFADQVVVHIAMTEIIDAIQHTNNISGLLKLSL